MRLQLPAQILNVIIKRKIESLLNNDGMKNSNNNKNNHNENCNNIVEANERIHHS